MVALLTVAAPSSCLAPRPAKDCVCSSIERRVSSARTQRPKAREGQKVRAQGRLVIVSTQQTQDEGGQPAVSRGNLGGTLLNTAAAAALSLSISLCGVDLAAARPEGVNRPDLLPESFTPVIDIAGYLTPQQEGRIVQDVTTLEEETGFKLRVLAQNYPKTPGLAVKKFWQVDDNTIVFVADPSMGNILNFNVGASVDLNVPRSFWSRLAGKYGNIFYWREKGEDASIEAAVAAIGECLREPAGPRACSEIK